MNKLTITAYIPTETSEPTPDEIKARIRQQFAETQERKHLNSSK